MLHATMVHINVLSLGILVLRLASKTGIMLLPHSSVNIAHLSLQVTVLLNLSGSQKMSLLLWVTQFTLDATTRELFSSPFGLLEEDITHSMDYHLDILTGIGFLL